MQHPSIHKPALAETGSFGLWLRHHRVARGLTQERLAELVGYAPATIRKLEADERRPSQEVIARLAHYFQDSAYQDPHATKTARTSSAPEVSWMWPDWLPLVGREQECALIRNRLGRGHVRLLTLHGPGGVGKTRLALHIAAHMSATIDVYVARLACDMDEQQITRAVSEALDLRVSEPQELIRALRERRFVLVLDQVCYEAAHISLVKSLLDACLHVQLVVTSHAPLCLPGERSVLVKPLTYPTSDGRATVIGAMSFPAVRLFAARAQVATPAFALTEANVHDIITLCAYVHGLPQAIELLSARTRQFEPSALLDQLHEAQIDPYSQDQSTACQLEHRLAEVLAWSCSLLSDTERHILRRLAAFNEDWTLSTAEAHCTRTNISPVEVLDAIEVLHDAGLVQALPPDSDEEPRFGVSSAVRAFVLGGVR